MKTNVLAGLLAVIAVCSVVLVVVALMFVRAEQQPGGSLRPQLTLEQQKEKLKDIEASLEKLKSKQR